MRTKQRIAALEEQVHGIYDALKSSREQHIYIHFDLPKNQSAEEIKAKMENVLQVARNELKLLLQSPSR